VEVLRLFSGDGAFVWAVAFGRVLFLADGTNVVSLRNTRKKCLPRRATRAAKKTRDVGDSTHRESEEESEESES